MSDLRYSYSGNRRRWSSSSSFPPRKTKEREDPEAGFSTLKQHNYDYDADALKLSAANVYHSIKKLLKLQKDIERKSEKRKSKYLEVKKEDYNGCLKTVWKGMKSIKEILYDEREDNAGRSRRPGQCHACFEKDRDLMLLQAQNDSLQTEYDRLQTLTSSKLRDNNPNLPELSDANRPFKIAEMFSELYDNEWTDAYDELLGTKGETATLQHLNELLMEAYDCCMRLSNPIRLILDTKSTKFQIDSEFRQKVIDHIKHSATAVISELKKDLQTEILKRCKVSYQTPSLLDYINKSIEICWLMAVQDPPLYLYNVKTPQFDSSKFNPFQRRGNYTEYVVWPAIERYKNGPTLSKGIAEGTDKLHVAYGSTASYIKPTGRSKPTAGNEKSTGKSVQEENRTVQKAEKLNMESLTKQLTWNSPCPQTATKQEDTAHIVTKQTVAKDTTYLQHKGIDLQEVGNGIQSFNQANESELKRTVKEIERLNTELQEKENRIQELVGLLEEKKNEETVIRNEFERKYNRKIKGLEGLVDKLKHLMEKEKRQKEETERRLADQIQKTEAEQKKKDAPISLSEMTSMQLRSNIPNIVDLCELNRPTKIGEQLSELYDKEWTDAFEDLMKENSEREAIKTLHDIIMEAHTSCLGLSEIESMLKNIETDFLQGPIDVEVRQKLVDLRKRNALISLENVTKKLEPDILSKLSGGSSSEALKMYVDACIRISWFMAIQDPPLRLYNIQRKEFDKEKYREYTQRGMYTDFVVWPALCLHEGGPLLAKGIAQGSKVPIEDKPPTPVAPEPASTDNGAPVKAESPKEKTVHEEKQPPIKHVSSVPVQAPLLSENTMNINESKQQNRESDGMMRPKKEENPTAETVSSDKQASSTQFVSTIMVSQTGNPISSTKEKGRKVGSDESLNNEIQSANAKETVGHRREMNATVGVSQTTEVICINEEDTVTAL